MATNSNNCEGNEPNTYKGVHDIDSDEERVSLLSSNTSSAPPCNLSVLRASINTRVPTWLWSKLRDASCGKEEYDEPSSGALWESSKIVIESKTSTRILDTLTIGAEPGNPVAHFSNHLVQTVGLEIKGKLKSKFRFAWSNCYLFQHISMYMSRKTLIVLQSMQNIAVLRLVDSRLLNYFGLDQHRKVFSNNCWNLLKRQQWHMTFERIVSDLGYQHDLAWKCGARSRADNR